MINNYIYINLIFYNKSKMALTIETYKFAISNVLDVALCI